MLRSRPSRAAALGAALSGANPKNLALTLAASASISEAGLDRADTALAIVVYVALGSITVAGSVLLYLVSPRRAVRPLSAVGKFMSENSAVIMMVVLLLLGAKLLGDGLGGIAVSRTADRAAARRRQRVFRWSKPEVALVVLDPADLTRLDATAFGDLFLRQPESFTSLPQILAQIPHAEDRPA